MSAEEGMDMYKLKRRIEGLNPTLNVFTGINPITFLEFMGTMREALDTTRVREAAYLRLIAYYL